MKSLELIALSENLNKINDDFNAWTNKLTSNGFVAGIITVIVFRILCIIVNNIANK